MHLQLLGDEHTPFPEHTSRCDDIFPKHSYDSHAVPMYPVLQIHLFVELHFPFPEQIKGLVVSFPKHSNLESINE